MKKILLTSLLLILFTTFSRAQHNDTNWTVPELFDFHTVIVGIWHDAYPSKNIEMLKGFVPDIKSNMEKINSAKLPGINQDKLSKWQNGLKSLNTAAEVYYAAAEKNDSEALLLAAENLHSNFESMVRIIKPVMKELDEYHKILYVIYHTYLPAKDFKSVSGVMDNLIEKAKAIPTGKFPANIGDKKDVLISESNALIEYTVALKEVLDSGDETAIISAIEKMHTQYQKLESVFE